MDCVDFKASLQVGVLLSCNSLVAIWPVDPQKSLEMCFE